MEIKSKESHLRSIIKAVSWRVLATTTTFVLALIVFQDTPNAIEKSSIVAGLEMVLKLVFYYLHERFWQNIPEKTLIQKNTLSE